MKKIQIFLILMVSIYGCGLFAVDDFRVGVWVHSSMFSDEKSKADEELNEKLGIYREIGIEDLYVFGTFKGEHRKGWNFLKRIIRIAHRNHLKVHPVITAGHKLRINGKIKRHAEWLIKDQLGKTMPYLNLSHPGARNYIVTKARKLLRYDIDGIHLDYIRFPYLTPNTKVDSPISILIRFLRFQWGWYIPAHLHYTMADHYFSYDGRTLRLFEEYYMSHFDGNRMGREHVMREWVRWNADNVTLLVREIDQVLKRSGKRIPLTAAVISNSAFAFHSLGQDWPEWARQGYTDVLCPMIYGNDHQWFANRLYDVLNGVNTKSEVYAGIAIRSSNNQNTPEDVKKQIEIAKNLGAGGVVFFSGNSLTPEFGRVIKEACH